VLVFGGCCCVFEVCVGIEYFDDLFDGVVDFGVGGEEMWVEV